MKPDPARLPSYPHDRVRPEGGASPKISVVVPVFDGGEDFRLCLEAALAMNNPRRCGAY